LLHQQQTTLIVYVDYATTERLFMQKHVLVSYLLVNLKLEQGTPTNQSTNLYVCRCC